MARGQLGIEEGSASKAKAKKKESKALPGYRKPQAEVKWRIPDELIGFLLNLPRSVLVSFLVCLHIRSQSIVAATACIVII